MLVHGFLENSAQRLGDKTALIADNQRISYQALNTTADNLAHYLVTIGIKRGDRVVILLDNSAEAVTAIFGILKAGAVFVCLNPTIKPVKLNYIFRDSGAAALITHTTKQKVVQESTTDTPALKHIIWHGSQPQTTTGWPSTITSHNYADATTNLQPSTPNLPRSIDVDLATIIYTSGSTGEPKGVVSAHYNVVAAARSISTYLKNVENDIILSALPLSFDYGLYQILMATLFGGTVVLEKSFMFPYKVLEKIDQEKATGFPIVPTMVALLLQLDLSKFQFSHLRYMSNTAAALPVAYIQKLQNLLPHVQIYSMYGLTECKRVAYLPPEYLSVKPTSVGIPMPNEEVFIVDENGNELGPDQTGELVVRGANVMQGYWNSPEETARTFRPGRYRGETLLYTGDLFKRDADGFLYFVGRKDDMIKTKGERVSPKEIENMLCSLEGVSEAAVIGVPDDILGQAIKAFIVPSNNAKLTNEEIQRHCTKNLEPFLVPKYIEFLDNMPKSNSGKIDKKALQRPTNNT
ncbi:class I adenylate-forming enzyme family protein [Desulfatitalea alkaliphila]|uniref:AMP-binding protein n=1 Tax=Desulfatitalea alkaliphila TaxID=2929485 RepID=A0AA41UL49_9BACT|nr:AMP-binding protein [Desulfatitalea alkaliphila]MCJ8502107.1 AMP-binding protein [Desulfatitalea alkaliphila]